MIVLLQVAVLSIAAFCAFGFLAIFEPIEGAVVGWRVAYDSVFIACVCGAARLRRRGGAKS